MDNDTLDMYLGGLVALAMVIGLICTASIGIYRSIKDGTFWRQLRDGIIITFICFVGIGFLIFAGALVPELLTVLIIATLIGIVGFITYFGIKGSRPIH